MEEFELKGVCNYLVAEDDWGFGWEAKGVLKVTASHTN